MEERSQLRFDLQTRILYKTYSGELNAQVVINAWEEDFERNEVPDVFVGLIVDYRKATIKADLKEHALVVEYYRKHSGVFGGRRIAIVVQDPKDIVFTILFEKKSKGLMVRNFNTIEAAEHWILS
ncbi:hypothetical protein [uncultured Draconibacterium sp.]|uniref:hypothetical protein n=1 Tax=uncultured Draconibacterium sp. TaxID=1573823 RepID=UPI0025DDA8B8|nr:hypothetical protein [uncultured Draconibacterium sp.]